MTLTKIKFNQEIRGYDSLGCGHFGASRGIKIHLGIDILTTKGEPIKTPISGMIKYYVYPCDSDLQWKGIIIENETYLIKILYIEPTIELGLYVNDGDIIGISQDISEKHSSEMQTHVHLEVYKNQMLIDPTNLF